MLKDIALVLFCPSDDINIYDNVIYNDCYLKMFSHSLSEKNQQKSLDASSNSNQQNNNNHPNAHKNPNNLKIIKQKMKEINLIKEFKL